MVKDSDIDVVYREGATPQIWISNHKPNHITVVGRN